MDDAGKEIVKEVSRVLEETGKQIWEQNLFELIPETYPRFEAGILDRLTQSFKKEISDIAVICSSENNSEQDIAARRIKVSVLFTLRGESVPLYLTISSQGEKNA